MHGVSYYDFASDLHATLYDLWRLDFENRVNDCRDYYDDISEEFISNLSSDIDAAISFFSSLNLNRLVDSYAMSFVDPVMKRLKLNEDKEKFTKCINELSKKYPDSQYVDWNVFRFYNVLHAIEELNTDDEDNFD